MLSEDFVFGVATSSFQIEGGADARLPSIWDSFCRQPGRIDDHSNGDVACDHFNRWEEDLELIRFLGADAYRFSLSWPRIVRPDGSANQAGLDFYRRILDRLEENSIRPFVTLYHWDLPQHLDDDGGWLNRDTASRFADYADIVSRAFGDRVCSYTTLNEPYCSAWLGYETGEHAPGHAKSGQAFAAGHNLLLAHARALEVLQANRPDALNGIVLNFKPCYPASPAEADRLAAEAAHRDMNRWLIEPVLEGRYLDGVAASLSAVGESQLADDLEHISRPVDFLGVNYYTRAVCRANGREYSLVVPESATVTDMGWEVFPRGLTDLLLQLDESYDLPPLFITDNGAAVGDRVVAGAVTDTERTRYVRDHLHALDEAMRQGVDVRGYLCWSLLDNFEWARGYSKRFGLVHVDFETQRRSIKASGLAYRQFLEWRRNGAAAT